MNKISRILCTGLCALPFLLTSCMEKELQGGADNPSSGETVTLRIQGEGSSTGTKTILENDSKVLWETGDILWVNGDTYEVIPDSQNPSCAVVEGVPASNEYRVFYTSGLYDNGSEHLIRKSTFDYTDDNISRYANVMAGYGTSTDITLYNLCGILKVGVTGEAGRSLTSVSICDNSDSYIDGYLALPHGDLADGNFDNVAISADATRYRDVTVRPNGAVSLSSEPQYFYFVLPCGTYAEGLTLTMVDTEGNVSLASTSSSIEIRRSVIKEMETVEFAAEKPVWVWFKDATSTTVTFEVNSRPGSKLYYQLFSKSLWDAYMATGNYATEQTLAMELLSQYKAYLPNESGVAERTLKWAYNSSLNKADLAADTEYKFLVAYGNGQTPVGNVVVTDVRTDPATGTAPELVVENIPVKYYETHRRASFNIKAVNAASIYIQIFDAVWYNEQTASGKTDGDIVVEYGKSLSPDGLGQALSSEGCTMGCSLSENTDYLLIVMACGEGGMETVKTLKHHTDYYINPSSTWDLYTENALLECGCFNVGKRNLHPVTVYRNSMDWNIFRIEEPFVRHFDLMLELPYGYYLSGAGGCDIIVDARNPDEVRVERGANTGLATERDGEIYVASRNILTSSGSFGMYDGGEAVNLGMLSMFSMSTGLVFGSSGETVLYLNPDVVPEYSSSMSTESFGKDKVTVEW